MLDPTRYLGGRIKKGNAPYLSPRGAWGHRCDYCGYDSGARLRSLYESRRHENAHLRECIVGVAFRFLLAPEIEVRAAAPMRPRRKYR